MEGRYTEYERRINYYETDKMGIVHHSNYIRFFEEARLDMMKKVGLDYFTMEEAGIIIPVLFVDCKYIKALHFDEDIVIQTKLTKYNGIKMEVAYEVYRKESDDISTLLCCLLFLLKDKRVAPYGFAGLAVILLMFCAAAWMLPQETRSIKPHMV